MRIETLEDLYVEQLKDLYNAEKQLKERLPPLVDRAEANELRSTMEKQVGLSGRHMNKLAALLERMDRRPAGEECEGMAGLLDETEGLATACRTAEATG